MTSYSRDVGVAPTVGATPTSRLTKTSWFILDCLSQAKKLEQRVIGIMLKNG